MQTFDSKQTAHLATEKHNLDDSLSFEKIIDTVSFFESNFLIKANISILTLNIVRKCLK
jgi:hypothetical protein